MAFRKDDRDKPRYHLLPRPALEEVIRAFMHGAGRYGAFNWRECTDPVRYLDAAARHVMRALDDPAVVIHDEESGLPVLAHAAASVLIALQLQMEGDGHGGEAG